MATKDVGIDEKTFLRWKRNIIDKRRGPKSAPSNKLKEEEVENIIKVSTSEEFMNLSPSKIVPTLADQGEYIASESTFYRVLKEKKLLAHRGKSKEKIHEKPIPLMATGPNQIYSWDITYLKGPIKGQFFYLYMFMDIWSRRIVGQEVHENEDMIKSSRLIERICEREGIKKDQLILHSDNGGPMKGAYMLATLHQLGIIPSFSRPRVSDDNPYSESLFKTLKYVPEYPSHGFSSIEATKEWVCNFTSWYNEKHLHSGIKFITPLDRHLGNDLKILHDRKEVYLKARQKNPNRWSKNIKNFDFIKEVFLNYLQEKKELKWSKC